MTRPDLGQFSMLDLFRAEAETQALVLTSGLLALERDHALPDQLEACMRAAHSLKGAARIVGLAVGVRVAHAMEDCFVAAQEGRLTLRRKQIDRLLRGTDLLARIAHTLEADIGQWDNEKKADVDACLASLASVLANEEAEAPADDELERLSADPAQLLDALAAEEASAATRDRRSSDRVLRVTAGNLNRLLALASESLVESRWVKPFAASLLRLKRLQRDLGKTLEGARNAASLRSADDPGREALADAQRRLVRCEQFLAQRLTEIEGFDRRAINGTTAEPSSLTIEERCDLVKVAVDTSHNRIPIVAATGSTGGHGSALSLKT